MYIKYIYFRYTAVHNDIINHKITFKHFSPDTFFFFFVIEWRASGRERRIKRERKVEWKASLLSYLTLVAAASPSIYPRRSVEFLVITDGIESPKITLPPERTNEHKGAVLAITTWFELLLLPPHRRTTADKRRRFRIAFSANARSQWLSHPPLALLVPSIHSCPIFNYILRLKFRAPILNISRRESLTLVNLEI